MSKKNGPAVAEQPKGNDIDSRRQTALRMSAFSDETRVGIVSFLLEGKKSVGSIAEAVGIPVVNASHHLNKLKQAGIVKDEKDGRFVMYSLMPEITSKNGKNTVLAMGICSVIFAS